MNPLTGADRSRQERKRRQRRVDGQHAASRPRRPLSGTGGALALAAAVLVVIALATSGMAGHTKAAARKPGHPPLLASTSGEANGATIDGIACASHEQALFHIHAHLAVYVNGQQRLIPEGIGIAEPREVQPTNAGPFVSGGSCFYWLHSHTRDGIIHIESPVRRSFTLGQYFDLWNQPLSANRVGPAKGPVAAYLNGKRYSRDPRSLQLKPHALIQLDVGMPIVDPQPYTFPQDL